MNIRRLTEVLVMHHSLPAVELELRPKKRNPWVLISKASGKDGPIVGRLLVGSCQVELDPPRGAWMVQVWFRDRLSLR